MIIWPTPVALYAVVAKSSWALGLHFSIHDYAMQCSKAGTGRGPSGMHVSEEQTG